MTHRQQIGYPSARRTLRPYGRVTVLAMASLVVGCTPQLYGYAQVKKSDQYISPSTLKTIVAQKLTREQVIQQLGPPDGSNAKAKTIGYERCTSSKGWGIFGTASVADCQRAVIWFDEEGRSCAQHSRVEYKAYDQSGFIYTFDEWLAADPPPPVIE
jgi:hypothetical protein